MPETPTVPWRHLLVTTDLSQEAEPALAAAAALARRSSARVTVLNVLDWSSLGDAWVLRESLVRLERQWRVEIGPRLTELCKRIFKDVPLELAMVEGTGVAATICRYAAEHALDLIVIATHGRTGTGRFLIGSVTERVVQTAPCDVIVVRSHTAAAESAASLEIRTILVPTDFSPCAERALERAVQLAKLTQAKVQLLHAYQIPTAIGVADVPIALPQSFYDGIRETGDRALRERVARVASEGVTVEGLLACDTPAHAILDAAGKTHADLIVMGTHGWTGMKHVLLGSVAERTVRLAPCAVLTVRATGS